MKGEEEAAARSRSDNNCGVMLLEDKEEGCQGACIPESLDYLSYIVGFMEQDSTFCSSIRVHQGDRKMEGRLSMMGDALMFWETPLARLPLFIPSQEGEMLFYKG